MITLNTTVINTLNTYFQHWTKCKDCSQSKLTENAAKRNKIINISPNENK